MLGLSLQGSPYLESDELVPLLGVEDLALVGRQA
jgi:hypothetical protein